MSETVFTKVDFTLGFLMGAIELGTMLSFESFVIHGSGSHQTRSITAESAMFRLAPVVETGNQVKVTCGFDN